MSIKQNLAVLMAASVIFFGAVILNEYYNLYSTMMQNNRALIQSQVETAYNLAQSYYERAEEGEISEFAAKTQARDAIQNLRYDGDHYFFINSYRDTDLGYFVVHPDPSMRNKPGWRNRDINGVQYTQLFIEKARGSGGYTEYLFPKPGEQYSTRKISYTKGFEPWSWAISTGFHTSEVTGAFLNHVIWSFSKSVVAVLLFLILAYFLVRKITRCMANITHAFEQLCEGNLDIHIPETDNQGELGKLANAAERFREAMQNAALLSQDQIAAQEKEHQRVEQMESMIHEFDAGISTTLRSVEQFTFEMQGSAHTLSESARDTNGRSQLAVKSADNASSNIETVAAATEEFSASINEIAAQVSKSSQIASEVVQEVARTSEQVNQLNNSATEIGNVVNIIAEIAEQTNLLALNATIEAARAGEAGRGFAVVASEVKDLASQTSKATEDITTQVTAIQQETNIAVNAIDAIRQTTVTMSEISNAIAVAVEEQNSATQEIARNIDEASTNTKTLSQDITVVSSTAQQNVGVVDSVMTMIESISNQSKDLKNNVGGFLQNIKTL